MREFYHYWLKVLHSFYIDIFKRALIFFILPLIVILVSSSWRVNPLSYLLAFIICFGVSFFLYMRKGECIDEFKKDN